MIKRMHSNASNFTSITSTKPYISTQYTTPPPALRLGSHHHPPAAHAARWRGGQGAAGRARGDRPGERFGGDIRVDRRYKFICVIKDSLRVTNVHGLIEKTKSNQPSRRFTHSKTAVHPFQFI